MSQTLFAVSTSDAAITTDDWYTPAWIFAAANLRFDLDVCAPVEPEFRTCPAARYLTIVDDGLTAEWAGKVWMNPPYSRAAPWVSRWANHPTGLALLPALPEVTWQGALLNAADAIALISADFGRPDGGRARLRWPLILAARGTQCVDAAARIACADKYAKGAYHVRSTLAKGTMSR